jgi:hypothetical protein
MPSGGGIHSISSQWKSTVGIADNIIHAGKSCDVAAGGDHFLDQRGNVFMFHFVHIDLPSGVNYSLWGSSRLGAGGIASFCCSCHLSQRGVFEGPTALVAFPREAATILYERVLLYELQSFRHMSPPF